MAELDVSRLITVAEAIAIIDAAHVVPRVVRRPLHECLGLRLAQDVIADRDYPPFAKSLMDGYAVRSADVRGAPVDLRFAGEIPAGTVPQRDLEPGEATAIMTGAPMPGGADGVVPIELTERDGTSVRVLKAEPVVRYVAARGSDCEAGRVVLRAGTVIGPAHVAVAATVGAASLDVYDQPSVAVLGTGDELVDADQEPGPGQIRNSNTPMLLALLARLGCCRVTDLGTARDDPAVLRAKLAEGLTFDALFVTGGMSMGEYDYVPRLLQELGVGLKITKLRIKPGKPFVFGHRGRDEGGVGDSDGATKRRSDGGEEQAHEGTEARGHEVGEAGDHLGTGEDASSPHPSSLRRSVAASLSPTYVFGLPGNPVSAYVCTVRLASRLLHRMAGGAPVEKWLTGRTDTGLLPNGPREFYQPVVLAFAPGRHSARAPIPRVHPLAWKGSADLFTLAAANALLVRGENEPAVPEGTMVRVLEI